MSTLSAAYEPVARLTCDVNYSDVDVFSTDILGSDRRT